ncbi:hypothetical protein ACWEOE_10925 [Amycolatopsis sp. NPDC004368]
MASVGTTVNSAFDPFAVQLKMDEKDARYALAGLVNPQPGSVMSYRSGVFAGGAIGGGSGSLGTVGHGGLRVTTSGLNAVVAIGNCLIDTPSNGPYLCGLDSQKTLSLAAASGSQRRLDLVVARVYDDRNSAIASTTGDRRFTVQVVTGDNTSGTPVLPTGALPANGWIPLASIQIEAGGTISAVNDLRGPGLVARGGRRILYGNDAKITSAAFLEAGAYAGDTRYVVGHPFPAQTYYIASDATAAGWRGDGGKLIYTVQPPADGFKSVTSVGSSVDMVSVTIPAFGIPVVLTPRARVNVDAGRDLTWECRTKIGATLINFGGADSLGADNDFYSQVTNCPDMTVGPFTTQQTVTADVFMRGAGVNALRNVRWQTNNVGQHQLQVVVEPANIDPIKMWL